MASLNICEKLVHEWAGDVPWVQKHDKVQTQTFLDNQKIGKWKEVSGKKGKKRKKKEFELEKSEEVNHPEDTPHDNLNLNSKDPETKISESSKKEIFKTISSGEKIISKRKKVILKRKLHNWIEPKNRSIMEYFKPTFPCAKMGLGAELGKSNLNYTPLVGEALTGLANGGESEISDENQGFVQ